MDMRDLLVPGILILVIFCKYSSVTEAAPSEKRQGMFGLCQGWGAGCALDYRAQPKDRQPNFPPRSAISAGASPESFVPSYLFTSGRSWNPIGKRSAFFTDIPYLRNPFVSLPRFRRPPGPNNLSRRYPLAYKSTFDTRSQDEPSMMDE